jgi:uncharacterized protein
VANKPGMESDLRQYLENELNADAKPGNQKIDSSIVSAELKKVYNPWMLFFLKYDPAAALEELKKTPVLALNGSTDLQVPAQENIAAIEKALKKAGNKKATFKVLPGLNHLFQTSKTGLPSEYAKIEETFSPVALAEIEGWIKEQTK